MESELLLPLSASGLKMGARSDPYNRGIVGLIFTASANLEQAVGDKIRYTKILADHISLKFEKNGDEFSITYSILEGYSHRDVTHHRAPRTHILVYKRLIPALQ